MFSKKLEIEKIEEMQIKIKHLQEEMTFQIQAIKNIEHEIIKLDGYIRSLRGLVNRMRGDHPKEEDINTNNPTDYLNRL